MNRQLLAVAGVGALVTSLAVLASEGFSQAAEATAAPRTGACMAEQEQIRAVPERVVTAWAANDAEAMAAVFAADTDFVIGDGTFLRGRDELRQYMAEGFDGFLQDTRVTAPVESVRCLSPRVGVVHTLGGILLPGESQVPPERQGVQVFVVTKHGADWLVDVYQNTRIDSAG